MELKNLGQTAASALIHMDIRLEREHWTMFRNKIFGIAAAATLGSAAMLGSTSAYALKVFDTAPNDRAELTSAMMNDSVTYAAETLMTNMVTKVGDTTYYNVGGSGTLVLSAPADVGAVGNDVYTVTVTLDGMVFRTNLTSTSLASTGATWSLVAGGQAKDSMVVFRLATGTINAETANLDLSAQFAVSAAGGSATLTIMNQTLASQGIEGVSGKSPHGPANVIKVASALKETSTDNDLTATVKTFFKKFKDDMIVGRVGSVTIGFNGHRVATVGDGTQVVDGLEDILVTGQTTAGAASSSVSFMGDFSFADKVYVHGDNDCGVEASAGSGASAAPDTQLASDEMDIRMMEGTGDDAVVTGTTKPVNVDSTPSDPNDTLADFTGYLCIMVQGDDTDAKAAPSIPNTGAYTAMGSYKELENAAMRPMGAERTLGMIMRDGTEVQLPYLSTNQKFNQRIRIVNRSSEDAKYEMKFHGVGDMAGTDATGTLDAKSVKVLSLRNDEVVEPGNGNNTSGTLIVEAQLGMIDVATVQINRETGNSDTVVYSD